MRSPPATCPEAKSADIDFQGVPLTVTDPVVLPDVSEVVVVADAVVVVVGAFSHLPAVSVTVLVDVVVVDVVVVGVVVVPELVPVVDDPPIAATADSAGAATGPGRIA